MALAARGLDPRQVAAPVASASVTGVLRFLSALRPVPSIQRVGYSSDDVAHHVWVFLREEILSDAQHIYALADEHLYDPDLIPLRVHVVPLSEVDQRQLPPIETIFDR